MFVIKTRIETRDIIEHSNKNFGKIRIIKINEENFFVGIDVASILGYSNTGKAISTHCKSAKKIIIYSKSKNTKRRIGNPILCVNSNDICILISKCKTKTSQFKSDFMSWLCDINLLSSKSIVIESRDEIEFFEKLQYRINLYNKAFADIYNMQSNIPITKEKECKLNPLYNVKLELQKSVCNGKYRLDCYIKRYNLVIEFDEEQHKCTIEEDKKRMDEVREWFIDNDNADLYIIRVDKNNPDYYIELIMGYMSIPI